MPQTVCLVALITAYQYQHPEVGKLIYCTRTVPEMIKCVEEIKRVIRYREEQLGPAGSKVRTTKQCLLQRASYNA
jgi:DNA excision repair protein ERCC-2